jgi:hypothetical protein
MPDLEISTGKILEWAEKLERRADELGEHAMRRRKKRLELAREGEKLGKELANKAKALVTQAARDEAKGRFRFGKIKRHKQGTKRFAIVKPPDRSAELVSETLSSKFHDILHDK